MDSSNSSELRALNGTEYCYLVKCYFNRSFIRKPILQTKNVERSLSKMAIKLPTIYLTLFYLNINCVYYKMHYIITYLYILWLAAKCRFKCFKMKNLLQNNNLNGSHYSFSSMLEHIIWASSGLTFCVSSWLYVFYFICGKVYHTDVTYKWYKTHKLLFIPVAKLQRYYDNNMQAKQ